LSFFFRNFSKLLAFATASRKVLANRPDSKLSTLFSSLSGIEMAFNSLENPSKK